MSRFGDFYENSVTGERAVVLRGDEDGAGQSFLVHLTVKPGGAVVGEHVHPGVTERFLTISGELGARIDGVEKPLGAGREETVPVDTPHDWWNDGEQEASVLLEIDPPDPRFEMMIATLFGLANAGRTNEKGMPNQLQLAMIGREFSDVIRFTKPPEAIQKVAFVILGTIGGWRGYKGIYPEYLGPHGRTVPDPDAVSRAGITPPAAAPPG